MLNLFQANDDARWLRLMCGKLRKVRIAPVSNAYHLSVLGFHSRNLEQLQDVEPPGVEKEGVMPKQFAELCDCRIILGKHLCSELRQRPAYLGLAQFHDLPDLRHLNALSTFAHASSCCLF